MKKTFLVIAIVALASFAASAQTHNLNISLAPYCDTFALTVEGPPDFIYVGGTHYTDACDFPPTYIGGFRHSFYTSIDPDGSSTILDMSDPFLAYVYDVPWAVEWVFDAPLNESRCGWAVYEDYGAGHVLANAGTCSYFTAGNAPKVNSPAQPVLKNPKSN